MVTFDCQPTVVVQSCGFAEQQSGASAGGWKVPLSAVAGHHNVMSFARHYMTCTGIPLLHSAPILYGQATVAGTVSDSAV